MALKPLMMRKPEMLSSNMEPNMLNCSCPCLDLRRMPLDIFTNI
ncbi:MAG: hypothetical protein BWY27_00798 [Bacteroidetes bacterium ADurb.Bin234]|nr:MAG: hypothetical protein BWY27_00798 [Bacteroidetes bacterium ADurb.Bin234]